jgi:hypothetical protein
VEMIWIVTNNCEKPQADEDDGAEFESYQDSLEENGSGASMLAFAVRNLGRCT